jgi:hypothetical protein
VESRRPTLCFPVWPNEAKEKTIKKVRMDADFMMNGFTGASPKIQNSKEAFA